jgi:ABC-type lipoprotein release transport system permease subunit
VQSSIRFYLAVAWRNLWRHRRRTLITAGAMGLGVAMCMASIALQDGMYAQMMDVMVTSKLGHVQLHHPDYPGKRRVHDTIPGEVTASVEALATVENAAPRMFSFALAGGDDKSAGAQLVGVSPKHETTLTRIDEKVVDGAWLSEAPAMQAVIGVDLAKDLKLSVGDELVLVGQDAYGGLANDLYSVVGTIRSGQAAMDRGGVWLHLTDLQTFQAMEGRVHELIVVTDDISEADALRDAIAAVPSAADLSVRTWNDADPVAAQMMALQDVGAFILLGIVLSVAALGILNTMLMSVFERMREFGVLRALGLAPRQLVILVVLESLLLATVATAMGLVMGGAMDAWMVYEGVDFSVDGKGLTYAGITLDPIIKAQVQPAGIIVTVVCVYVVTLVAAIWPALRAARLEPVQAMREN